ARIFYRNAFNLGLPLIECDTDRIKNGDEVRVDLEKGIVSCSQRGYSLRIKPFTEFQKKLVREGGIVSYYKRYGGLKIGS
ncbi:MAG: 3-isopropylmalate dehydratase, partial [Candidatus Omnitrophota bacterium]